MNGAHIQQPRGRFALTGGRVILPQHIATDKMVIVEGGKIVAITDRDSLGSSMETIAVDGRYITPGLIDIHIHGALGYTFNQPTSQAFAAITAETVSCGPHEWPSRNLSIHRRIKAHVFTSRLDTPPCPTTATKTH